MGDYTISDVITNGRYCMLPRVVPKKELGDMETLTKSVGFVYMLVI